MKSAREGATFKEIVIKALEAEMHGTRTRRAQRIRDPLIACKNNKPIALTNAQIEDLLT